MRITFLNPVGTVGGAERVLLLVLRTLGAAQPQVERTLILLSTGPLREEAEVLGVKVIVVPLPAALARVGDSQLNANRAATATLGTFARVIPEVPAAWRYLSRLKQTIRLSAPDVIYSNGLKTHLALRLVAIKHVPVVWHLHDFYSQRPLMARLLKLAQRGVRCGIAISDAVARDTQALLPQLPVAVVKNAVDTDRFCPGAAEGAWLDELAGLPSATEGTIRVGLVATYANWKGHVVFLEALARVAAALAHQGSGGGVEVGTDANGQIACGKREVPRIRGYIVGGPIYSTAGSQVTLERLKSRVDELGLNSRVGFVQFQKDTTNVYRSLDIVVHASTRPEPFGLTIAEAMACGRAVIVAAAGGAQELFTEGVDAIGHVPGDVASLAEAILRLVHDQPLRDELGWRARKAAVERFSEERFGRELALVISRVASC